MTQSEFNDLWKVAGGDKKMPACKEGMVLLKKWHDSDSGALVLLPVLTDDLEQPLCVDPDVESFVRHRNTCKECISLR